MPASLSIKNVPDEVVVRLRERAKQNHRSLQGELLAILEETVRPRGLTVAELRERVRSFGVRTGSESTQWIREDRDARPLATFDRDLHAAAGQRGRELGASAARPNEADIIR